MKKINKSPLAVAMGAALISTFATATANAEANPFGMTELSTGYMQVAEAAKTAEMACGASMNMAKPKTPEGACAGTTKAAGTASKTTEAACGAMMKGKEGACGEMMKGESMKGKEGACGAEMHPATPAK